MDQRPNGLNVKPETLGPARREPRQYLQDIGAGQGFLNRIPFTQEMRPH